MHTKDFLAQELRKAGLAKMADKATIGYYHDYLSPLPDGAMQLERDLREVGTKKAEALRQRHLNGDFDASKEESDAWAESDEGQSIFSQLTPEMRKIFE